MSKYPKDEVLDSFDKLREENTEYAAYSERFGPLAEFLTEYEYQKGMEGITQCELAERMGTTQSAISRFESMKHTPSYDLLIKAAKAFSDRLFVSPAASVSISLPYDLRGIAKEVATRRGITVSELMIDLLRSDLAREKLMIENSGNATLKPKPTIVEFPATYLKGRSFEEGTAVVSVSGKERAG